MTLPEKGWSTGNELAFLRRIGSWSKALKTTKKACLIGYIGSIEGPGPVRENWLQVDKELCLKVAKAILESITQQSFYNDTKELIDNFRLTR